MSKNVTRRAASKFIGGVALAASLVFGAQSAPQAADKELTIFDWSGYEDENFFPAYKAKHGTGPTFAFFGDEEEAFTKLKSGFKADIAHPCSQSINKWRDAGLVKPIDTSRIPAWKDLNPKLRDLPGFEKDGKNWIIPIDWGNTAIVYRTDLIKEAEVQSLQALADPKFKGKVSVGDNVDDAYALGALAIGLKDWTKMTDEQFKAASDFLRKVHKNVRFYWADNAQLSQGMASGEVSVAWAWNETSTTMAADGHKVAMKRDTDEGSSTWACGFVLLKDAPGSEDKAYDFLNAWMEEGVAKYLVEAWGYGHSNATALAKLDSKVLDSKGLSSHEKFVANTLFQAPTDIGLRQKMIAEFEKIKAGF